MAGPVAAADLAVKAPVAPIVPIYNWTGVYFGVNGGGGWGRQQPLNIITDRFDAFTVDVSGGLVGGTSGAQVQVGHVVLGVESDLDWANISGSGTVVPSALGVLLTGVPIDMHTKMDWVSTARVRAGYAQDNWLLYTTAGVALEENKTTLTTANGFVCGTTFLFCTSSARKAGAALGMGVEYGLTPNWSAKLEYMYVAAASLEISKVNLLRIGLNYRFGGN
jgi:outer membrane immunogenic protein